MNFSDKRMLAEYYDLIPLYVARRDIEFYVNAAKIYGAPVLEIGCGTGRTLIPVAKSGIEIYGIDYCSEMIDVCNEKIKKQPKFIQDAVKLFVFDMRDFLIDKKFKLITLPFRSFHYLTSTSDQIAALKCVYNHLEDDGFLILDIFNPSINYLIDSSKDTECEQEFIGPTGEVVYRETKVIHKDIFNQRIEVQLLYNITYENRHARVIEDRLDWRYLFRFEVEHLLARCGFTIEAVWSNYNKEPYGSSYPGELICLAKK